MNDTKGIILGPSFGLDPPGPKRRADPDEHEAAVVRMEKRYADCRDIWTGKLLTGQDKRDWLRENHRKI